MGSRDHNPRHTSMSIYKHIHTNMVQGFLTPCWRCHTPFCARFLTAALFQPRMAGCPGNFAFSSEIGILSTYSMSMTRFVSLLLSYRPVLASLFRARFRSRFSTSKVDNSEHHACDVPGICSGIMTGPFKRGPHPALAEASRESVRKVHITKRAGTLPAALHLLINACRLSSFDDNHDQKSTTSTCMDKSRGKVYAMTT
ncbi:hypothetical protein BD289DRAFT_243319 [Coniella lustricola]|uniref:Uncharacterized protein n=1 Tax=Coniella lustricola TaxID=2025994 RepID=A0A2T3A9G4_9PEZI|nr:hypothetical protein BD289DRAFT_243319 [Coniella lustricola]